MELEFWLLQIHCTKWKCFIPWSNDEEEPSKFSIKNVRPNGIDISFHCESKDPFPRTVEERIRMGWPIRQCHQTGVVIVEIRVVAAERCDNTSRNLALNLEAENLDNPRKTWSEAHHQKMCHLPKTTCWPLWPEDGTSTQRVSYTLTTVFTHRYRLCWAPIRERENKCEEKVCVYLPVLHPVWFTWS